MAKQFQVSVDITMSKTLFVEAENEEQAKTKVNNWVDDDPYYYAKDADYITCEITDVDETNENKGNGEGNRLPTKINRI